MILHSLRYGFCHGIAQPQNMRKFFKQATFEPFENPPHPLHQYVIKLDEKTMKTPYRHVLAVPSRILACLVTSEFNRQEKHLKTGEMPILALCRTAVDADIEGNITPHLKHTVYQYLKTDTLNFYDRKYEDKYRQLVVPLLKKFSKQFNIPITPSSGLQPPSLTISPEFDAWVNSLNNWQLIGLETMTVWLKSTISAYSMISIGDLQRIKTAAMLEEIVQMEQNGEVEEKLMDSNQVSLMVNCGKIMYEFGDTDK